MINADLLSVRKIPVKTHPDFLHLEDGDRAEDPLVEENLTKIRHCIMTDRALNELVSRIEELCRTVYLGGVRQSEHLYHPFRRTRSMRPLIYSV